MKKRCFRVDGQRKTIYSFTQEPALVIGKLSFGVALSGDGGDGGGGLRVCTKSEFWIYE